MQASQAKVVSKSRVKSHFSIPLDVRSSILLFHSFIQHCFSPKEEGRRERKRGKHLSLFQSHSILLTSYEESRGRRRTSRFTSEKKDVDHREEGEGGRAGGRQAGKKNDFDTEWRRRAAIQSRRKPSARQMRWCSVVAAADGRTEAGGQ